MPFAVSLVIGGIGLYEGKVFVAGGGAAVAQEDPMFPLVVLIASLLRLSVSSTSRLRKSDLPLFESSEPVTVDVCMKSEYGVNRDVNFGRSCGKIVVSRFDANRRLCCYHPVAPGLYYP